MEPDRAFVAGQDFLLGAKMFWLTRMTPALAGEYRRREALAAAKPASVDDVEALIGDSPLYRAFAFLERHLQREKYSGRYGLQPWHEGRRAALEQALDAPLPEGLLTLDPELELPRYYTGTDIHQHPGGVWSDRIAPFVYERGARSTTPMLGQRHADLHDRFTALVGERIQPGTIADLGCGFGKSTRPFYQAFRDAEVTALDLSAPCVTYAAQQAARDQARNVRFRQADAQATGLAGGAFDLVTSTMLLHEMPPPALDRLFAETFRLLAPGGKAIHLDFWLLPDLFRRFLHYGHSRRNNEPFMPPLAEMDLKGELERHGFRNVEILPFAEADGALDPASTAWRFPWTVILAEKPA